MGAKYQAIAREMLDQIHRREITESLPSEMSLMDTYQVSRNTIRKALDVLANQGVIKRVQGSGYYVNFAHYPSKNVMNLANKVGLNGLKMYQEVVSKVVAFDLQPAGLEVSKLMGCAAEEPVYRIERLRQAASGDISYELAYYLKSVIPYLSAEICEGSIFQFIYDTYDIEIGTADEYVGLHRLSVTEAAKAQKEAGRATLQIEEINYLKGGQAFNYSRTYYFQEDLTLYYHVSNYVH